jgi:translation initiation factor IF-1
MPVYILSFLLGAAGLLVMAVGGLGHHSHTGHAHGHGPAHGHGHAPTHGHGDWRWALTAILSPRVVATFLLGFGAIGLAARHLLAGPLLLGAAVVGGALFERLVARPLWNLIFRFESRPAATLESCVEDQARAVTGFDRNGHGLVALELDGQIVQVLATLRPADRDAGVRVRAGDSVRVEAVDAARNRCTVSAINA